MTTYTGTVHPPAPLSMLDERNHAAERVLGMHARRHAAIDGTSGFFGGLIPFGGPFVAVGQLVGQAKHLYPRLAEDLSAVYGCPPPVLRDLTWDADVEESLTHLKRQVRRVAGSYYADEVAQTALMLALSFDSDFVREIAMELARENAPGLAASLIPVVGAFATAGLDAMLGVNMTWRVGAMMAMHLQHDGFVGNRHNTWVLAKTRVVPSSMDWDRPGALVKMRSAVPSVGQRLVKTASRAVSDLQAQGLSRKQAKDRLMHAAEWRVPFDIVKAL